MKYLPATLVLLVASALSVQSQPVTPAPDALPEVADAILYQPAVSPDGNTIAFVHDGDIWTVPAPRGA
jgi:Tol biopolymer transport system component